VDPSQIDELRRWGEQLSRDDSQPELRSAGRAILLLIAENERLRTPAPPPVDGGPDEGTRGATSYWQTSDPRSSYQPVPDQGFKARAGGPSMLVTGPSAEQQPQQQDPQHPGARP